MPEEQDVNLIPVFRAALESMGVDYDQDEFTLEDLVEARAALRYVDKMIGMVIDQVENENEGEDDDATG